MVSSFLDDSSCYSKGIISSSFSKVQYQSYSHGDFSSPFLGDSSIFYVAFAPARSPVVVRQYLPVLATGNIGFVAVTRLYDRFARKDNQRPAIHDGSSGSPKRKCCN
ncbi:Bgt-60026 [Blumeria graminis f. sp. tritici]|uniref:Bgt-60026 n=1 Tax=Blumeria graminis f. sp. tritici TaxID=62690 RepID=A0A9X9MIC5_BLUGR|nr:Bgt-60026 [Blumeria graminis f. sp. tritici]